MSRVNPTPLQAENREVNALPQQTTANGRALSFGAYLSAPFTFTAQKVSSLASLFLSYVQRTFEWMGSQVKQATSALKNLFTTSKQSIQPTQPQSSQETEPQNTLETPISPEVIKTPASSEDQETQSTPEATKPHASSKSQETSKSQEQQPGKISLLTRARAVLGKERRKPTLTNRAFKNLIEQSQSTPIKSQASLTTQTSLEAPETSNPSGRTHWQTITESLTSFMKNRHQTHKPTESTKSLIKEPNQPIEQPQSTETKETPEQKRRKKPIQEAPHAEEKSAHTPEAPHAIEKGTIQKVDRVAGSRRKQNKNNRSSNNLHKASPRAKSQRK
jgi:hypothetical protein